MIRDFLALIGACVVTGVVLVAVVVVVSEIRDKLRRGKRRRA